MNSSDEELMHAFYAGEVSALDHLAFRHGQTLAQVSYLILLARTGSVVQSLGEWDLEGRLSSVWDQVVRTSQVEIGRWPHQRITVLAWLIHLVSLEMDRHLGFRPPY